MGEQNVNGGGFVCRSVLAAALVCLAMPSARALPCMVMGEKTAVVVADVGERSPPFLTQSCESLKLKSGSAMVSWIGADGKAQLVPITAAGVQRMPAPGREQRSGKVVWEEITSRREVPRPAVSRSFGEVKPAVVFVPVDGLKLQPPGSGDWLLRMSVGPEASGSWRDVPTKHGSHVIERQDLPAGESRWLEWDQAGTIRQLFWRGVDGAELAMLDVAYQELSVPDLDERQRAMLRAMWFDQMRLQVNLDMSLGVLK